jgi:hypothetical protein
MAESMKMTVFWGVVWWKFTDVSEMLNAAINQGDNSSRNIPEDSHLYRTSVRKPERKRPPGS